jgi:cytochrome c biogenesis protein CcdA
MISRTWYFIVGGIAVFVGLHLIGLFKWNLPIPVHLQPKKRGILGAFILGLFFGIVSSPCATPVLALILACVASKGEVAYGTSLLFVYAIGHCALIFLAGTAAGFVESFVQSKGITNITEWGKRIGGSIVSLVGIYLFYLGITL